MDLSLVVDRGILFRHHELNERPKCSVILHCFKRHSISIWQNYHFDCSLYDCSVVFLPIYHKQTSSIIYQTKVDRNSCHSTEKAPQPSVLVDQVHASSRAVCMLLNNNWTAVQSSAFSGRHLCFFPIFHTSTLFRCSLNSWQRDGVYVRTVFLKNMLPCGIAFETIWELQRCHK